MDNRETLLARALELFAARGYDGVGVQEIVSAAGVTKPTLYHYFKSKRGLLEALLETHLAPFHEKLDRAVAYRGDLPLSLQETARAYLVFAQASPLFYRFHLALEIAPPESEARTVVEPYLAHESRKLESLFREASADHGNMRGRHARYALTLRGMIDAYALAVLEGHAAFGEALLADLVQQFSYGIYS